MKPTRNHLETSSATTSTPDAPSASIEMETYALSLTAQLHGLQQENGHLQQEKERQRATTLKAISLGRTLGQRLISVRKDLKGLEETHIRVTAAKRRAIGLGITLGRRLMTVRQESRTDFLTGLSNKREIYRILPQILERIKREERPYIIGFIAIDIDHFKKINDTYGHHAGDKILKHVATILLGHVREYDLVARNGGEEFLIALAGKKELPLLEKAEKIRQEVAKTPYVLDDGRSVPITVSLGVSVLDPGDAQASISNSLHEADSAMYLAKESGRNRVCRVTQPVQPSQKSAYSGLSSDTFDI